MKQKFKSAVDWWFYAVLLVIPLSLLPVALSASIVEPSQLVILSLVGLLATGLPVWLLLATYYVISDDKLTIRSGPFRWKISLVDIHKIESSNSPLSSPALSLKRLRIEYGVGKSILISPKEQAEFWRLIENSLQQRST